MKHMTNRQPTGPQLAALRNAIGGCATTTGTTEHAVFEEMRSQGWVQEFALTANGIAWHLSAAGLALAYPNRPAAPYARADASG